MALRLVTCIWQRPEITRAFMWHLQYLRDETGLPLPITIGYSDDKDLTNIKDLISKDDHLVLVDNEPVSNKWEITMQAAYADTKDAYFMQVGSDDFLNAKYVELMAQQDFDHAGVNEFIVYSPMHGKAVRHVYKPKVFTLTGAGRVISRKALEKVYSHGTLYQLGINKGLDNSSELTLKKWQINPVLVDFRDAFVDVKSQTNIHNFEEFENGEKVELDLIKRIIPTIDFV